MSNTKRKVYNSSSVTRETLLLTQVTLIDLPLSSVNQVAGKTTASADPGHPDRLPSVLSEPGSGRDSTADPGHPDQPPSVLSEPGSGRDSTADPGHTKTDGRLPLHC